MLAYKYDASIVESPMQIQGGGIHMSDRDRTGVESLSVFQQSGRDENIRYLPTRECTNTSCIMHHASPSPRCLCLDPGRFIDQLLITRSNRRIINSEKKFQFADLCQKNWVEMSTLSTMMIDMIDEGERRLREITWLFSEWLSAQRSTSAWQLEPYYLLRI